MMKRYGIVEEIINNFRNIFDGKKRYTLTAAHAILREIDESSSRIVLNTPITFSSRNISEGMIVSHNSAFDQ